MKRIAMIMAMILMLAPMLVSCGSKPVETVESSESVTTVTESEEPAFSLDTLPELDYGKQQFGIYCLRGFNSYVIAEEEDGDILNDAVFQRNVAIEDKYNLDLYIPELDKDAKTRIRNLLLSGDKTYDLYISIQNEQMPGLILSGYFVDWNDLPHVDYTQPYWNGNVADDLNFAGKVYVMGGDINLATYNRSSCIMFNKNLFDDLGIDYPYQDVYDYKWTIDKMIEISKQGYNDLNGNTIWDAEGDRLGFAGWVWEMDTSLFFGLGGNPITTDANNLPVLSLNNERTVKMIDKIIELFDGKNGWASSQDYSVANSMFSDGRLLMRYSFLENLPQNRDSEYDFGILPMPMLDEEQGEYRCCAVVTSALCYVPVTNTKLDETSIILEGMSIESYNRIRPVYYDAVLDVKSSKDEETLDMVDIIVDTSSFMYDGFIKVNDLQRFITTQQNTFSSWYASNEKGLQKQVEEIADFYAK